MKKILALSSLALTLFSCQPENRVYLEHKELSPNVEWYKTDTRTFEVPVEDINQTYDFILALRYITGYEYMTADVKITETSPSGKVTTNEYVIKVRENNGDYIGEAGLDIWDLEQVVETQKKFKEKGTYSYTIEQNTPEDPLNYVMEIGVALDKK